MVQGIIEGIRQSPLLDEVRSRPIFRQGRETLEQARLRLHRARRDLAVARKQGRVRLWRLEREAVEGAATLLEQAPAPLEGVVEPLRRRLDDLRRRLVDVGIENYDEMNARAARDAVRRMDLVQLERVEAYERAHKARKTVLDAIEQHRRRLLGSDD